MISILKRTHNLPYSWFFLACFLLCLPGLPVQAQGGLTLSISPTLFEMTANPGQQWSSNIRVINSNPYEVTVFVDAVNFAPSGESGQGTFLPLTGDEADRGTIAKWITLNTVEYTIPSEQTALIPFSIAVPPDAPPGGHAAAVRVGTRPPVQEGGRVQVETSQILTALVFLRVTGDIIEQGQVREFRPRTRILEAPNATFDLRFENRGNVHLQPQGEIKIYNMWGQERGIIPVNQKSLFGKVLRESIRKYTFSWEGEWSLSEVGRYRAIATLAYGEEGRQFASAETTFWVIPWRVLLLLGIVILGFILFVSWAIKLYVRKMLLMAGVTPELYERKRAQQRAATPRVSVVAPIEAGILDLREQMRTSETVVDKLQSLRLLLRKYFMFIATIAIVILFASVVVWFVKSASVADRAYEVTVGNPGQAITISSEELEYDKLRSGSPQVNSNERAYELPEIQIINRSGVSGLAAQLRIMLEKEGYPISGLSSEMGATESRTVIVYDPALAQEALELSRTIPGALLSAYDQTEEQSHSLVVYVGRDLQDAL